MSEDRLSLLRNGQVRYELKTPYRDGNTRVICEPMDFIARLAAVWSQVGKLCSQYVYRLALRLSK